MDVELSESQRQWRDEVRAFLAKRVTPELRAELRQAGGEGGTEKSRPSR